MVEDYPRYNERGNPANDLHLGGESRPDLSEVALTVRKRRLKRVTEDHELANTTDDSLLLFDGRQRHRDSSDLPDTQVEQTACRHREAPHDGRAGWRVEIEESERLNGLVQSPTTNQMVLMDAPLVLAAPSYATADFGFATVALNYEEVARLELVALKLAGEQFEIVDLEARALDVGDTGQGNELPEGRRFHDF